MAEGFILIPDQIAKREDLSATHKLVLGAIGRIQGKSASCYPSIRYIAESSGMSDRQVQRVVKDLVKRKLITRLFHPHKTSTYSAAWATARNLRRKWAETRKSA
jgi:DNA-binding MarR family transcriptional regulator